MCRALLREQRLRALLRSARALLRLYLSPHLEHKELKTDGRRKKTSRAQRLPATPDLRAAGSGQLPMHGAVERPERAFMNMHVLFRRQKGGGAERARFCEKQPYNAPQPYSAGGPTGADGSATSEARGGGPGARAAARVLPIGSSGAAATSPSARRTFGERRKGSAGYSGGCADLARRSGGRGAWRRRAHGPARRRRGNPPPPAAGCPAGGAPTPTHRMNSKDSKRSRRKLAQKEGGRGCLRAVGV